MGLRRAKVRRKRPLDDTCIETFRTTSPNGKCDAVLAIEEAGNLGLYIVRSGRKVDGRKPVAYLVRAMPSAGAPIEWVDGRTVRFHGSLDDITYSADDSRSVTIEVR